MQAGFKLKKGKSKAKTHGWSFATHLRKWKDSDLRPQALPCWLYVAGRSKKPYFRDDASKPGCSL